MNPCLSVADTNEQLRLCTALVRYGLTEKALNECRRVLSARPDTVLAYRLIGESLARQGNLRAAVAAYDKWARLHYHSALEDIGRQQIAIGKGVPPVYIVAMQKSASEYLRWVLTEALLAPSFYPSSGTFPHDMLVPNFVRIV